MLDFPHGSRAFFLPMLSLVGVGVACETWTRMARRHESVADYHCQIHDPLLQKRGVFVTNPIKSENMRLRANLRAMYRLHSGILQKPATVRRITLNQNPKSAQNPKPYRRSQQPKKQSKARSHENSRSHLPTNFTNLNRRQDRHPMWNSIFERCSMNRKSLHILFGKYNAGWYFSWHANSS